MISGIINVYKEKGYTSFDVVAKLRGILKMKKIGHTGTLDPDAEGVLPVCLGKATKVCGLLTDEDKEYETVMLLGTVTDTQDITGTVLRRQEVTVTENEVRASVMRFVGPYMQVPPMYSAKKVNGKKLYDLARQGMTVERSAQQVNIASIEILSISLPRVRMRVTCSKGTYIRTLCEDIGQTLGCGACMESLLRTRVAGFCLADALAIAQIEERVRKEAGDLPPEEWRTEQFSFLMRTDAVFPKYQKAMVKKEAQRLLRNGNPLPSELLLNDGMSWEEELCVYDAAGRFAGIYRFDAKICAYRPYRFFLEE